MTRITAEWLKKADDDLIAARYLFQDLYPKQIEISCYHYQQAAEKSLKAFLVHNELEPPKIHNLIMLCQECCTIDAEFETILGICSNLTVYGVQMRYPNEMEITEADTKQAGLWSEKICAFCKTALEVNG